MNTCGTCRFRGKEQQVMDRETYEYVPVGYFLCERIKHDDDWKYQQGQRALVVDGSGYFAALCVEDDFGCAMWEAK